MKIQVKDYYGTYSAECYWLGVTLGFDIDDRSEETKYELLNEWKKHHEKLKHLSELVGDG